jgi:hypothetical protein
MIFRFSGRDYVIAAQLVGSLKLDAATAVVPTAAVGKAAECNFTRSAERI